MIGIIDYGMGNLGSVVNACAFLNRSARILRDPSDMDACRGLILPGQGAFGDCMRQIRSIGFEDAIQAWIDADRPFLGICIGLQILFESSEESPDTPGMGVFSGTVKRFPDTPGLKVPQMGWNRVEWTRDVQAVDGVASGSHFYFVHSYYVDCSSALTLGRTEYGLSYTSAVARGRLTAFQFHPEKSQRDGLALLTRFSTLVEDA